MFIYVTPFLHLNPYVYRNLSDFLLIDVTKSMLFFSFFQNTKVEIFTISHSIFGFKIDEKSIPKKLGVFAKKNHSI